ncbi:putative GST-like protein [Achaetomium macrosporum]|uniref:GST-like protein n=1 Tax=Achaetomium macrosporum TaxID=79813 RepID=A0AAN7HE49_9PEZI|nr:putative GST-like protein [Achaetomium macrosporum]
MTTYHLYITNKNYSSWSLRPWLLLRQLGIPFVEEFRPLTSGSFRQPQWHEFSPVAHVPCLHVLPPSGEEKEKEKLVLWESLAIIEFLAEQHPDKSVYPIQDKVARAWARSAVAEMHAGFGALRQEMGMNVGVRIELSGAAFTPGLVADLKRLDELWTEGLRRFGGPFLAGREFTAVDAFYAPVVLRLQTYVGTLDRMGEEARGYVQRMLELEGIKEWVDAALKETGREVLHDAENVEGEGRRLVADMRAK